MELLTEAAESILVKWTDPENNHGEIDKFEIKVTAENEEDRMFQAKGIETSRKIPNLKPFKDYTVSIVTFNKQLDNHGGLNGTATEPQTKKTWPASKRCYFALFVVVSLYSEPL